MAYTAAQRHPCLKAVQNNSFASLKREMASMQRKLTAKGPRAAYEMYRASQRNADKEDSSIGTPLTINIASPSKRESVCQSPGISTSNPWSRHVIQGNGMDRFDAPCSSTKVRNSLEPQSASKRSKNGIQGQGYTPGNVNMSSDVPAQQIRPQSRPDDRSMYTRPANQTFGRSPSNDIRPDETRTQHTRHESKTSHDEGAPTAFDRLQYEALKKQVKEYKDTVANMQRIQTSVLQKAIELPRHCRWECVSKVLTEVVSSFMVGSDKSCTLYPTELELIPPILGAFGISMDQQEPVEQFFTKWGKGGQNSLMIHVYDNLRDRRGAILRALREEFYVELGLPKPRDAEGDEVEEWKRKLAALNRTKEWRINSDYDALDPWGTPAVHHSIARVLKGIKYDPHAPVTISIH